ncbi:MAG: hypothetical protein WD229_02475 [Pirellulales bacterium]
MCKNTKALRALPSWAIAFAIAAWCVQAKAQEESSVLVEQKAESAAGAPALSPPANEPTLPPPERPVAENTTKQSSKAPAKRPFMRPAVPKSRRDSRVELTAAEESIPAPAGPSAEVPVRPTPPLEYDSDRSARRMYAKYGTVELVMVTQNPADGCFYEIPLCIPACCTEAPRVSSRRGIFGRGIVEYCWPCGFEAEVKFRHVLGDVRVDYEGD